MNKYYSDSDSDLIWSDLILILMHVSLPLHTTANSFYFQKKGKKYQRSIVNVKTISANALHEVYTFTMQLKHLESQANKKNKSNMYNSGFIQDSGWLSSWEHEEG